MRSTAELARAVQAAFVSAGPARRLARSRSSRRPTARCLGRASTTPPTSPATASRSRSPTSLRPRRAGRLRHARGPAARLRQSSRATSARRRRARAGQGAARGGRRSRVRVVARVPTPGRERWRLPRSAADGRLRRTPGGGGLEDRERRPADVHASSSAWPTGRQRRGPRRLGLILGGDVTIMQERMAIGSTQLPRAQTDETTLISAFVTAMVEARAPRARAGRRRRGSIISPTRRA